MAGGVGTKRPIGCAVLGCIPAPEAMGPHGGGYEPRLALSSKLVSEAGQRIEDAPVELLEVLTPGSEALRSRAGAG